MFHPMREYRWSPGKKIYGFQRSFEQTHPEQQRMTYYRNGERPRFDTAGEPCKETPERSYIPTHPYYYSSKEYFHISKEAESSTQKLKQGIRVVEDAEAKQKRKQKRKEEEEKERNRNCAFRPQTCPTVERTNVDQDNLLRSMDRPRHFPLGMGIRGPRLVDPSYIPYLTPMPGLSRVAIGDIHRRKACIKRNDVLYPIDSGIIPRYMGHVPGQKFRLGERFGKMTKNAKEVGLEPNVAWGGLTSLAASYHPPPGW